MQRTPGTPLHLLGARAACLAALTLDLSAAGCGNDAREERDERAALAVTTQETAPAHAPSLSAAASTALAPSTASVSPTKAAVVAPALASVSGAEGLSLARLAVATGVENREPVTTQPITTSTEPLYAFLDLSNPTESPRELIVTFERADGTSVARNGLEIPAHQKRWRTWAKARALKQAGTWTVFVRTPEGQELSRQDFEVAP